jgi:hypothetical protein
MAKDRSHEYYKAIRTVAECIVDSLEKEGHNLPTLYEYAREDICNNVADVLQEKSNEGLKP